MSFCTLNGVGVLSAKVTLPRHGLWQAELELDTTTAPTGKVTLAIGKKLSLVGAVMRADNYEGKVSARVIGGAGGLDQPVPSKWYAKAAASLPLTDLLEAGGEVASSAIDGGLLTTVLSPGWAMSAGSAATALDRLVEAVGAASLATSPLTWRALPDGSIWFGLETWPEAPPMADAVLHDDNRADDHFSISTEAPTLLPGMSYRGRNVSVVRYAIDPESQRIDVWSEPAVGVTDRLKRGLLAIVESMIRKRVDYLAMYPGKLVRQNANGTVDVVCEDARIGSLAAVPIRIGVPGVTVVVKTPSRVLITFENGNPQAPIACLWDAATLDTITIDAKNVNLVKSGGLPIARQGDMVGVGGGLPPVPNCSITFGVVGAPTVPVTTGVPVPAYLENVVPGLGQPVYGSIQSGRPTVKA